MRKKDNQVHTPTMPVLKQKTIPRLMPKRNTRYHNNDNKATNQRVESSSVAHEGRDDEQEFTRIPIVGEDSEDYNSSNDSDNDNKDTKIIYKTI